MYFFQAITQAAKMLCNNDITGARLEARILLAHIIQKSQEYILLHMENQILSTDQKIEFFRLVTLRCKHTPIAYLLGYKEFYSRNFIINDTVLIPRSDSEILIEAVLKDWKHKSNQKLNILELGVGSGCLIITLLLELRNSKAVALDISDDALRIAKLNKEQFRLGGRLKLLKSNWFSNLTFQEKFDIIISNPPYISQSELNQISAETMHFEPKIALFADDNGLQNYEIIAQNTQSFLKNRGSLYLEVGYQQSQSVIKIFQNYDLKLINIYKDLQGYDRCLKMIVS